MTIDAIISNTEALDFNAVIGETVEDTKEIFADLQTDQMLHGKNAEGNVIGTYRSEEYAEQKSRQNPLAGFGNVDLRREENFYRGIEVHASANAVTVTSRDGKTAKLVDKYGEVIFGLSPEYLAIYQGDFGPVATDKIKKQILK